MIGFFKNNNEKLDWLLENVWYPETFDKDYIGRMNLEKNGTVEITKPGTLQDYLNQVKGKRTPKISSTEIVLEQNQDCLQLVFWYNTGNYDTSNFQNGLLDKTHRYDLKKAIQGYDKKNGKVIVFMAGNLVGKEWEFKHLVNAVNVLANNGMFDSMEDEELPKEVRRIFFGLKKRKEKIINDIKFALKAGADEIILMKGTEEFNLYKKTDIDILKEITEEINDPRIKYISEGTSATINFTKKISPRKTLQNTIEIRTDLYTTSDVAGNMERPKRRLIGEMADLTFNCGGNYTGSIGDTNEYFPSGQLTYFNAKKGANPNLMFNQGNIFQVYAEGDHDLSVVKGGQEVFEENAVLLNILYNNQKEAKQLGDYIKERIEDKQAQILCKPIILKRKYEKKEKDHTQEEEIGNENEL